MDDSAYYDLAAAVIRYALLDYLNYGKEVVAFEHPSMSNMTSKKFNSMRNTARGEVTRRYNVAGKTDIEMARLVRQELESQYIKNKLEMDKIVKFFYSDAFKTYAQNVLPEDMHDAAEVLLKRWIGGERNPLAVYGDKQ